MSLSLSSLCLSLSLSLSLSLYMYIFTHTYVYTYIHILYMYTYIYIYIYIYKYIHTQRRRRLPPVSKSGSKRADSDIDLQGNLMAVTIFPREEYGCSRENLWARKKKMYDFLPCMASQDCACLARAPEAAPRKLENSRSL